MARHTKEWNEGYQAAIDAIKKQMQGGSGSGSGSESDLEKIPQPGDQGNESGEGSGGSGESRTDQNDPNHGIVRPEDCCSNSSEVEDMPGTAGGFFDKKDGDKIAESEGYDKEGGSSESLEREWKEASIKAASNQRGDVFGRLKSTLEGLYKTTTDWKSAFKQIIGRSINNVDTRRAMVNKNILVSQGRPARTDKDKFDNMDYMLVWIDSSGSMSDSQLKMCLSEVYSLALAKKPLKLVVVQCDTRIQDIKEYKNIGELKKDTVHAVVKGRGGTLIKPLWDFVKNDKKYSKVVPDLTIIFTDGGVEGQYRRDRQHMNWLCWCILDNPSFNVQYPDQQTKIIHLNSRDI